jgi:hypothetical protein
MYFTEHLVDTFKKLLWKSNLNHKILKSFDPTTQEWIGFYPTRNLTQIGNHKLSESNKTEIKLDRQTTLERELTNRGHERNWSPLPKIPARESSEGKNPSWNKKPARWPADSEIALEHSCCGAREKYRKVLGTSG